MAEAADDIRAGMAEVFDALRNDVFLDSSDTLTLLKQSETTNAFDEVFEITGKWWLEYDERRKSPRLEISDNDDDITDAFAEATHFKVNDTVYTIEKGSTIPPIGISMMWVVFGERQAKRGNFVELW